MFPNQSPTAPVEKEKVFGKGGGFKPFMKKKKLGGATTPTAYDNDGDEGSPFKFGSGGGKPGLSFSKIMGRGR